MYLKVPAHLSDYLAGLRILLKNFVIFEDTFVWFCGWKARMHCVVSFFSFMCGASSVSKKLAHLLGLSLSRVADERVNIKGKRGNLSVCNDAQLSSPSFVR